MTTVNQLVARQITRSAETLLLAMEALDDAAFFAENANGFSAAWVLGHLACVADLFSSWFDGNLLFGSSLHAVFNETNVAASPASRVYDASQFPKEFLLLTFREAVVKAKRTLYEFAPADWDRPAPACAPLSMRAAGDVWEILAVHIYWHNGELAGSMKPYYGTYTLNTAPHHAYAEQVEALS